MMHLLLKKERLTYTFAKEKQNKTAGILTTEKDFNSGKWLLKCGIGFWSGCLIYSLWRRKSVLLIPESKDWSTWKWSQLLVKRNAEEEEKGMLSK